jgi:hypothetical protein
MPQVIVLALLGAGMYAGYRWLARAAGGITEDRRAGPNDPGDRAATGRLEKNLGTLEYDRASGVYRPAKRA